jgi:hypothetical protein
MSKQATTEGSVKYLYSEMSNSVKTHEEFREFLNFKKKEESLKK